MLFNNGMGWVPGDGRLVIEQTPNRLTVTKHIPDSKLDRLLALHRRFDRTVVYKIIEPRGRAGGAGAGPENISVPSWRADRLALWQTQNGPRMSTLWLSLDGDRLKFETHVVIAGENKESRTPEWFERVR